MMREWRKAWDRDATYRNLIKGFLKANKPAWAAYIRDMFIAAPLPTSGSGRCMDNNFIVVIYTHVNLFNFRTFQATTSTITRYGYDKCIVVTCMIIL